MSLGWRCIIGVLCLALTSSVWAGVAQEPKRATVNADRVNVRARPNLVGVVVTQVHEGDSVEVIDTISVERPPKDGPTEWTKIVLPDGADAWVHGQYVDDSGAVTASELNVRAGPSLKHGIIGRLDEGATVGEVDAQDPWLKIQPPQGAYAFVASQFLDSGSQSQSVDESSTTTDASVDTESEAGAATTQQQGDDPTTTEKPKVESVSSAPPEGIDATGSNEKPAGEPASEDSTGPSSDAQPGSALMTPSSAEPVFQGDSADEPSTNVFPAEEAGESSTSAPSESEAPSQTKPAGGSYSDPGLQKNKKPGITPLPSSPVLPDPERPVVLRDGILIKTKAPKAPTEYALFDLYRVRSKAFLNFDTDEAPESPSRSLLGRRVNVQGKEYATPDWPMIPTLDVQSIQRPKVGE